MNGQETEIEKEAIPGTDGGNSTDAGGIETVTQDDPPQEPAKGDEPAAPCKETKVEEVTERGTDGGNGADARS